MFDGYRTPSAPVTRPGVAPSVGRSYGLGDDELHAEAQAHLATCHNCHVVLDTTQRTIFLYRETHRAGIPQARRGKLYDRLQQAIAKRPDCP